MADLTSPCERWDGWHRPSDDRPIERKRYVYRLRWEAIHGPLPDGHLLHHLCDNPWCINVEHLEAMTHAEHAALHLAERNRQTGAGRTHCRNGHPLVGDNVQYVNSGRDGKYRRCRTCQAETKRRYRQRQRRI